MYRDTGTFAVKLTPIHNGCPGPSVTKTNLFHKDPPVSNFGFEVNCSNPLLVKFTDSSIVDPGLGNISYSWDFGDGQSSTDQNPPEHTFPASGQYNVQLTVNGSCTAAACAGSIFSVNAGIGAAAACAKIQLSSTR